MKTNNPRKVHFNRAGNIKESKFGLDRPSECCSEWNYRGDCDNLAELEAAWIRLESGGTANLRKAGGRSPKIRRIREVECVS
jgi:hypothetical protein